VGTGLKWGTALAVLLLAAQAIAEETPFPRTRKEKESYASGVDVANAIKRRKVDVDSDLFIKGVKDGLAGGTLLMSDGDIEKTLSAFKIELRQKMQASRQNQSQAQKVAAMNSRKAGEAFLAENAKKEGVVTLPSGLQYKVLAAGGGRKPTDADMVACRYLSTFVDGAEFDRSDPDGKPANLKLKELVVGWREGLKLMPVGSKWQLFIPPGLAYGAEGDGLRVGPDATLLIEVELLAIR
jgi:FKBP-type peptidyl-prolyl cis-trans isomerase